MTTTSDTDVVFRRVAFHNFKALGEFSVTLERVNVLTGPNNSGKSTVIGAFRALSAALRTARSHKPQYLNGPDGRRLGYAVPRDGIPISLENARTDYGDRDATVVFEISNGNSLQLHFTETGPCQLFARFGDTTVGPKDRAEFSRCFPVTVGVVPVLGPMEHDEVLVEKNTVDRNLATHRASRNFRNYWYHYPEDFEVFAMMLANTWPGMSILRPEAVFEEKETILRMFCAENRIDRELFWAGFGFQIWCQLLTHISRERASTLLVLDEPETYLHPDLHRRLFRMLRDLPQSVLLATHSSEIIAEAEPAEVLIVDKARHSAHRLTQRAGVGAALQALGSSHTTTVTAIARTERVLFVEGDDARVLYQLAGSLGKRELALGTGLTSISLGGHRPKDAAAIAKGIKEAIGERVRFAIVLDRDFRCEEELKALGDFLSSFCDEVHTHGRKEIENYCLVPAALTRAVHQALERRVRYSGGAATAGDECDTAHLLATVAESLRITTQVQFVERRVDFLRSTGSGSDRATMAGDAVANFERGWADSDARLGLISGKVALAAVNQILQERYAVSLSVTSIVSVLQPDEIPHDLARFLSRLERFRNQGDAK